MLALYYYVLSVYGAPVAVLEAISSDTHDSLRRDVCVCVFVLPSVRQCSTLESAKMRWRCSSGKAKGINDSKYFIRCLSECIAINVASASGLVGICIVIDTLSNGFTDVRRRVKEA